MTQTVSEILTQIVTYRWIYYIEGRESESDVAWNGYIDFSVVYLH